MTGGFIEGERSPARLDESLLFPTRKAALTLNSLVNRTTRTESTFMIDTEHRLSLRLGSCVQLQRGYILN